MQKGEVFFNLPYVISCETLVRGPKHVPLDFHHVLNPKNRKKELVCETLVDVQRCQEKRMGRVRFYPLESARGLDASRGPVGPDNARSGATHLVRCWPNHVACIKYCIHIGRFA
jgi:hypothetical protein